VKVVANPFFIYEKKQNKTKNPNNLASHLNPFSPGNVAQISKGITVSFSLFFAQDKDVIEAFTSYTLAKLLR
jgi:hypothetical protein